jgi:hypothetical protein
MIILLWCISPGAASSGSVTICLEGGKSQNSRSPGLKASALSERLDKGWAHFHRFFEMGFFMVHPGDEAYQP